MIQNRTTFLPHLEASRAGNLLHCRFTHSEMGFFIMPRKPKVEVFVGFKINRLTLIEFAATSVEFDGKRFQRRPMALWKCDCGKEFIARVTHVIYERTVSCGCYAKDKNSERLTTHGLSKDPTYNIHQGIKNRCQKPQCPVYKNYGGRGIRVCDRWLESYENFIADMGFRPSPLHTLERINNDGNYEPSNCKWATRKEQCQNKRNNVFVSLDGERMILSELSRRIGVSRGSVSRRIQIGQSPEQIRDHFAARSAA